MTLFGNVQNDWDNHPDSKNVFILDLGKETLFFKYAESLTWESDPTVVGDVPKGRKDVASVFFPEDGVVIVAGGEKIEKKEMLISM